MKTSLAANVIGWYGTVAILVAYALSTFSILYVHGFWYQFLNATGAFGIVVVSLQKKNYQPAILNIVWLAVALIAIVRLAV